MASAPHTTLHVPPSPLAWLILHPKLHSLRGQPTLLPQSFQELPVLMASQPSALRPSGHRSPSILSRILSRLPFSCRATGFSRSVTLRMSESSLPWPDPSWELPTRYPASGDWYPPLTYYPAQGPVPDCLAIKFQHHWSPNEAIRLKQS